MGNWKNLQPVGNSDRFVRKVPEWSKESYHTVFRDLKTTINDEKTPISKVMVISIY